eukprot:PLAT718.2.p1 GENE.PLAT718.2~~PLAT718.2.p1  ORF type:complete len:262 (+),score=132.51 PLAT718.2:3-788(+)
MGCCSSSDTAAEKPLLREHDSYDRARVAKEEEDDGFMVEKPSRPKGTFEFDKKKSLRPKKRHVKGTKRYELHQQIKMTLGSGYGDLREAVKLPPGEELNEWLAVHTIDFYNEISLLYGTISELCTRKTCPIMSAGSKFTYLWADGVKIKAPRKVPAREYVRLLMEWVDTQLSDESLFPTAMDYTFSDDFEATVRIIFKRLFRVYAHVYHSHFRSYIKLGAEAHLNTCFKRFIFFVLEFALVEPKELGPLQQLIDRIGKGSL